MKGMRHIAVLVLGCVLGLLVGLGRLNPQRRTLYAACTFYLTLVRGTPLLVQLFLWFFGLPHVGVILPAYVCGILGLGIYSAAYVSEIVRGAIQSIERGQMEAARSLGLPYRMAMRRVILPQAFVRMIPPLGNNFIAILKDTSLLSVLGVLEITQRARQFSASSFKFREGYFVSVFIYLVLVMALSLLLSVLERRMTRDLEGGR